jgi:hypothetical protein
MIADDWCRALLLLLVVACARSEPQVIDSARTIDVRVLDTGTGAGRAMLSPNERWAAVERDDSVSIVALTSGGVVRTVEGHAIGAPDDSGLVPVLHQEESGAWRVGETAGGVDALVLAPPPGAEPWTLEAALGAGGRKVIALTRNNERWIAAIAPDGTLRTRLVPGSAPGEAGATLAMAPTGASVYVVRLDGEDVYVDALSASDLAPAWSTKLVPPRPHEFSRTGAESLRAQKSAIPVSVAPWGDRPAFLVQPSGDGTRMLVMIGERMHGAISEPPIVVILDALDGRIVSTRRFRPEGPFIGHVRAAAAVPGTGSVVLLHVSRHREGSGESLVARFGGVTRWNLTTGDVPDEWLATESALKNVVPSSIAVSRDGRVFVVR